MKDDIEAAERGDRAAAMHLVAVAADRLSRGIPLDEDLSEWLGGCLTQIAEGVKPGRALGLSDSGRPPADDEKQMMRWQCFAQIEHLKSTGQAKTVTEAAALVAVKYDLEISSVETYRKQIIRELKSEGLDVESIISTLKSPDSTIKRMFESVEAMTEGERVKIAQARNRKRQQEEGN